MVIIQEYGKFVLCIGNFVLCIGNFVLFMRIILEGLRLLVRCGNGMCCSSEQPLMGSGFGTDPNNGCERDYIRIRSDIPNNQMLHVYNQRMVLRQKNTATQRMRCLAFSSLSWIWQDFALSGFREGNFFRTPKMQNLRTRNLMILISKFCISGVPSNVLHRRQLEILFQNRFCLRDSNPSQLCQHFMFGDGICNIYVSTMHFLAG